MLSPSPRAGLAEFDRAARLAIELLDLEGRCLSRHVLLPPVAMTAYILISPETYRNQALSPVPFRREAHSTYRLGVGQTAVKL